MLIKNQVDRHKHIVNEFYKLYRVRKEKYINSIEKVEPISQPSCWLIYCKEKMKEAEAFKDIFKRFNYKVETKEDVDDLEYLYNKFRNMG
jgi:hypothetical protein